MSGMDYQMTQVQLHCKVCAKRLLKAKSKCTSIIFHCKAYAAKLQNAFGINTNNDDSRVHPEHFCPSCKLALDRAISAMHKKIHPLSEGDAFRLGMQGR